MRHGLKKDGATAEFESIGDVLLSADASLCRELLHTTLPQLLLASDMFVSRIEDQLMDRLLAESTQLSQDVCITRQTLFG